MFGSNLDDGFVHSCIGAGRGTGGLPDYVPGFDHGFLVNIFSVVILIPALDIAWRYL